MKTVRVGKGVWLMDQTDFVHFAKFGDFTRRIYLRSTPITYCIYGFNWPCVLLGIIPAYVNRTAVQKLLVLL
jgi:hypothetical protein